MPYIKTRDGHDIYVKEWGKGDPVVLIHGWPLSRLDTALLPMIVAGLDARSNRGTAMIMTRSLMI
jgi:pimeloyl-ACP methyl ester carboxylesterase